MVEEGLPEGRAGDFAGWWCQRRENMGGLYLPVNSFHEDPLEGCPGPHVPLYRGDRIDLLDKVAAAAEPVIHFDSHSYGGNLDAAIKARLEALRGLADAVEELRGKERELMEERGWPSD